MVDLGEVRAASTVAVTLPRSAVQPWTALHAQGQHCLPADADTAGTDSLEAAIPFNPSHTKNKITKENTPS